MTTTDTTLVRRVHKEEHRGDTIYATLTRFGGLSVFVYDRDTAVVWQGDNILAARKWVEDRMAP